MSSQHLTEPHLITYDIDSSAFDADSNAHSLSESFSLPSWKEIGLPGQAGHNSDTQSFLLDGTDAQLEGRSPHNSNCLSRDTLRDNMLDREYESSKDDSKEILERLQESGYLSQKDQAWNAIGESNVYVSPNLHSTLC